MSQSLTFTFEDPPKRARGRGMPSQYAVLAEQLKQYPGKWAKLDGVFSPGRLSGIRNSLPKRHGFTVRQHQLNNGECEVFIQYNLVTE